MSKDKTLMSQNSLESNIGNCYHDFNVEKNIGLTFHAIFRGNKRGNKIKRNVRTMS